MVNQSDQGRAWAMLTIQQTGAGERSSRLKRRKRRRKRSSAAPLEAMPVPDCPHKRWSMDFTSDTLGTGRNLRTLNVVDDCTRLCVAIEVEAARAG